MAITLEDFQASFPEFADLSQERFDAKLEEASLMVNATALGDKADLALKYLLAHLLVTFPESGAESAAGQTVKRTTVGGVSVEYATDESSGGGGSVDDFSSTAYGRFYLKVIRSTGKTLNVL